MAGHGQENNDGQVMRSGDAQIRQEPEQATGFQAELLTIRDQTARPEANPEQLRQTNIATAKALLSAEGDPDLRQVTKSQVKMIDGFLKFAFENGGFSDSDKAPVAGLLRERANIQKHPLAQRDLMDIASRVEA